MLSAQRQADHGSPYVLKKADVDSYRRDMESWDRRKGTLDNYHRCLEDLDILESGEDCVDTSIPYDLIAELVRQQLSENASWNIESFSVDGSDSSASTYSMAQELYVMLPDDATVQTAKEKLAALAA